MKITIPELEHLSREQQDTLLEGLILSAYRDYLSFNLKKLNIPKRSSIYKNGTFPYTEYFTQRETGLDIKVFLEKRKIEEKKGYKDILDHSKIEDWIDSFISRYTLERFAIIVKQALHIYNLTIQTEEEPLKGL
jgi:hypothetical protein